MAGWGNLYFTLAFFLGWGFGIDMGVTLAWCFLCILQDVDGSGVGTLKCYDTRFGYVFILIVRGGVFRDVPVFIPRCL